MCCQRSMAGTFGSFMASDAFFVPSQKDIEFIKLALKKAGLTDDQIQAKTWQYYKKRVRRRVPSPSVLTRDFKRLVSLFANVTDNKTKKKLFCDTGWNLYKQTLRHIKKGCLSDIPGKSYCVKIGEDSMGTPLFSCIRGTDGTWI